MSLAFYIQIWAFLFSHKLGGGNKIFLPVTNVIHHIIGENVSQYEYRRESNRIYMSTDGVLKRNHE